MIDDESHVNFENKLITSGTRVFLWCSFFDRKGMRKKEKIRKKGEKAVTLSCFLRSNIDTMANNRMHQTQQQPLFGVYSRGEGEERGLLFLNSGC